MPDELTSIATFLMPPAEFELGDDPIMLHRLGLGRHGPCRRRAGVATAAPAAPPDIEVLQPTTWTAWQSAADSLFPKGVRAYWKNTSFDRLDDATIEVIVDRAPEQTWRGTAFDIHHMGGAFGRVPAGRYAVPGPLGRATG